MKFVFVTGGTGGHIMPAIAIREAAIALGHEVVFIHSGQPIDEKICAQYNVRARVLKAMAFTGKPILHRIKLAFLTPFRFAEALKILREEKPDVVMGFGGYVSFIPLIAAKFLRFRTTVQEQNGSLGLANRILSTFVDRVFIPEHCDPGSLSGSPRLTVINNPVRSDFSRISDWADPNPTVHLLLIGGSQGAVSLNSAFVSAVKKLREAGVPLSVMHQTGSRDFERIDLLIKETQQYDYHHIAFTNEMPKLLDAATLVISRAGALSAAEIGAAGRPAVFVPLNIARAHQRENVVPLEKAGAAVVVVQDEKLEEKLFLALKGILTDNGVLSKMAAAAQSVRGRFETAGSFVEALLRLTK